MATRTTTTDQARTQQLYRTNTEAHPFASASTPTRHSSTGWTMTASNADACPACQWRWAYALIAGSPPGQTQT